MPAHPRIPYNERILHSTASHILPSHVHCSLVIPCAGLLTEGPSPTPQAGLQVTCRISPFRLRTKHQMPKILTVTILTHSLPISRSPDLPNKHCQLHFKPGILERSWLWLNPQRLRPWLWKLIKRISDVDDHCRDTPDTDISLTRVNFPPESLAGAEVLQIFSTCLDTLHILPFLVSLETPAFHLKLGKFPANLRHLTHPYGGTVVPTPAKATKYLQSARIDLYFVPSSIMTFRLTRQERTGYFYACRAQHECKLQVE
ncbi:hypothetical protein BKA64DRAFT_272271 [Cadophora sp. MPI-SDFR-AT-0126]|nr:hypothetical protein BKA64DRAFT_272271 [Leotiomycetes sp. MPI-SDFR-AT-0126]